MKSIDYNTLDQIAKSNLAQDLSKQALQNIQIVQVPTQTGFLPQPVVLPIMEKIINRQAANVAEQKIPEVPQTAQYYLAIDGQSKGPFTAMQIKEFIAADFINAQFLCWAPGFEDWKPIDIVNEFK